MPASAMSFVFGQPEPFIYSRNLTAFLTENSVIETPYAINRVEPSLHIELPTDLLNKVHIHSTQIAEIIAGTGIILSANWQFSIGYDVIEDAEERLMSAGFGKGLCI